MTQRLNATQDIGSRDVWLLSLTQAAQQVASIALLLTGCWRILHGNLTVGMLAAFQVLLAYFLKPVQSLVNLGSQAQTAGMDLLRIKDVLDNDLDPAAHQDEGADTPKEVAGHLRLEALSFGYCPVDEPLIDGLNLDIPAHKHVAIVGATGSGKSTLANLILGLLHPWNGKILLDEVDLDHYGRSARSRLISNVSQELFVFEGTLRDNLSLWDHSVPDEQLLKALDDAQLLEDVRAMGEGLQLHLLEGGKNLSQGQVQRLEIARALLPNPRLLVMDEATSALDVATEAAVLERIAARSCTCLMITHRLKTIQNCDCIFVMDAGRIVQQGTHAELASQSGVYQKLLQSESFT
jgi:ATP-binding cassette subfamily C protein